MRHDWRKHLRIEECPTGLSIWIGCRWIVDMSCIKETGKFLVAVDHRIEKLPMCQGGGMQEFGIIEKGLESDPLSWPHKIYSAGKKKGHKAK